ncbi:MAG: pentapeptide repeat-containing protein [Crocosphaera sp.]|nr:pentapeptide repeat-containing protein [Crocosphaera sp.]
MKASEILQQYANGRRDFRNLSLRGQSFREQNLSGADFSGCDLRGTNFKQAILKATIFRQAKAGLQKRWVIILVLISWLISAFSGFLSIFSATFIVYFFRSDREKVEAILGIIVILLLILILIAIIRQGLNVAFAFAFAFAGAFAFAFAVTFAVVRAGAVTFSVATAVGGAVAVTFAVAVVGAVAVTFAVTFAIAGAFAITFAVTFVGAGTFFVGAFDFAGSFAFTLLGGYLGWRSLKGDPRDKWIRRIAIPFATIGGTSFYGADLTEADFTEATLKSTDFREANLTRTCWRKTKKIDRIRPGKTLLADESVRDLMVTGKGENQSYEKADLRGANLNGVNLNYANLKFADLSEATLKEADLDYANLTEVNAIETNFTGAKMTGVCLEAWNIDSNTKLDEVDCQFVYLLEHPKPKTDDRERRPSSGIFQPGEFTKLFQEVLNTVDLIFQDGIDWKAFVTAFKKLQIQNEDVALEIQSIENKGNGVVIVKVAVPPDTNKEKIHEDFTQNYNLGIKALETEYKAKLEAKDSEINSYYRENVRMERIINLLATRPIQIENTNIQGDENMNNNRNINARKYTEGNSYRTTNINDQGTNVEGDYYNNPEARQNLAEAAGEIQELLEKLSETYGTNTTTGKMKIAGEAIETIENNPQLKQKILSAIKAGSLAAIDSMLNHPAASFVIAAMEDLQDDK